MTEAEKAKLAKDFRERYVPVVQKWFKAYQGRIPFQAEDFTLDKFHSRFGDYLYTFMIGEITFTTGWCSYTAARRQELDGGQELSAFLKRPSAQHIFS